MQRRVLHQPRNFSEHLEDPYTLFFDISAQNERSEHLVATNHQQWINAFQGLLREAAVKGNVASRGQLIHELSCERSTNALNASCGFELSSQLLDIFEERLS